MFQGCTFSYKWRYDGIFNKIYLTELGSSTFSSAAGGIDLRKKKKKEDLSDVRSLSLRLNTVHCIDCLSTAAVCTHRQQFYYIDSSENSHNKQLLLLFKNCFVL